MNRDFLWHIRVKTHILKQQQVHICLIVSDKSLIKTKLAFLESGNFLREMATSRHCNSAWTRCSKSAGSTVTHLCADKF